MASPYAGSGSVIYLRSINKASQRRLGSRHWRLSNTIDGKRARVIVPKSKVARPMLTEAEQLAIVARLAKAREQVEQAHHASVAEHLRLVGSYN